MALLGSLVVFFNTGFQDGRIHTCLFGEFVKRISFNSPACLFCCRPFFFEVSQFCSDRNHNADTLDNSVVLHRVKVLVVIDNPHLTADSFKSITGSGPVAHNGFVAGCLAVAETWFVVETARGPGR